MAIGRECSEDRAFVGDDGRGIPRLTSFTRLVHRVPSHARACLHGSGQWSMDYHVAAAGEFSLDGRRWRPREAHTAHLYAAGRGYWERSGARDVPFPETYLLFDVRDSADLDPLVSPGRGFARFLDSEGLLAAAFERLSASGASQAWRGQAAFLDVLDLLVAAQPLAGEDWLVSAHAPASPPGLVQRVEEHIQSAYHRPLTLAAMARAAGVSVSTLTHRYRLETGRTPIGRLMEHRLDVARGMLLKGASIKAVAAHTGFYDEFHLSKAFKRRFGLPPRRYARRRAAASAAPRG